jgi:hypothetical protein
MAKIQYIRTLESIAVRIRDLAVKNAPKDTGNLRNRIKQANTPAKSKMIKQLRDLSVVISLDYAPNGAEYGQFFNDPPKVISKRRKGLRKTAIRRGNWNYAVDAMEDKNLNKEFQDYLDLLGDYVIQEVEYELDKK